VEEDESRGALDGAPELRPVPQRRLGALAIAGLSLAVVSVLGIVVASVLFAADARRGGPRPSAEPTPGAYIPATATTSTPASGSSASSPSALPTVPGAAASTVAAVPRVAFRRSGALWVADEDGRHIRVVRRSSDGPFAISPDGAAIAFVDGQGGPLVIVDVMTGLSRTLGRARPDRPVWAPDGASVVFSSPDGPTITRVRRDGTGSTVLGVGSAPALSPDGNVLVALATDDAVLVSIGGSVSRILHAPGAAMDVAVSNTRIFVANEPSAEGSTPAGVWSLALDGTDARRLVGPPADPAAYAYASLCRSPDGARISFAAVGDDGYSRVMVVRADGTGLRTVSLRRDGYPLCWSSDGSRLYFIEGNAFQGQRTDLLSCAPDGTGVRLVVPQAGL